MRRLRALWSRVVGLFGAEGRDRDLSDELQAHLELHMADLVKDGVPLDKARRRALLSLGGLEQAKEQYRERRGLSLAGLLNDLRSARRSLRRQPAFTVTAVLTFAVGIGAAVGLFSVIDPLLWKPLSIERPERLVRLHDAGRDTFTYPAFEQLHREAGAFAGLAGAMRLGASRRAEIDGVDLPVAVQEVSTEYFDVLGVRPAFGRAFTATEPPSEPVAVLSDAFWRRQYQANAEAIGTRVRYINRDFTVIGVAPPGFGGLNLDRPADVWLPLEQALPPGSMLRTRGRFLHIVGRLRNGVETAGAAAQASSVLGRPVQVERGATGFSALRGRFGRPLLVLQLGVLAILLIACANLANLTLLRGSSRAREIATRRALGASRQVIVRQLFTETCLLGAAGAAVGVMVASRLSAALLSFLRPEDAAAIGTLAFQINHRLIAVLVGVFAASVAIAGLIPAILTTRSVSVAALRAGASSATRHSRRTNRVLAIGQVALSTFLVIGAAMFVRTLVNLWSMDAGFEPRDVLMADLTLPRDRTRPGESILPLLEELRTTLSSAPGVQGAAFSSIGPMTGYGIENPIYASPGSTGDVTAYELSTSPGFFSVLSIAFRNGRDFTEGDREGAAGVAIVNESFVRRFLGPGAAVGQRFGIAPTEIGSLEVVGVVEDSKWLSLREEPVAMYYRPFHQRATSSAVLVVRAPGRLPAAERTLLQVASTLEGRVEVTETVPFTTIVSRTMGTERMLAQISTALAGLALAVVAIGLYGLLAFDVAQRDREIGLRLALGATPRLIAKLVARDTLTILSLGVPLGLAAALFGGRAVAAMLFGLAPTDLATILIGISALVSVAAVATYLPARKAARIEPCAVLRNE